MYSNKKENRIYYMNIEILSLVFREYREIERVAGIEPASLAWKARGYSRR